MAETLLHHLREHLAARGVVRKPKVAAAGLHPLYLEPRLGTPAPGEMTGAETDTDAVLGATLQSEIAVGAYESWYSKPTVDFYYRVRDARDADAISAAIRGELEDRRAWTTTTGLFVIESGVWRPKQRLGSDEKVFTYTESFWFQVYTGRAPRDG